MCSNVPPTFGTMDEALLLLSCAAFTCFFFSSPSLLNRNWKLCSNVKALYLFSTLCSLYSMLPLDCGVYVYVYVCTALLQQVHFFSFCHNNIAGSEGLQYHFFPSPPFHNRIYVSAF